MMAASLMIESFRFTAQEAGTKLVFFGAVHGNETCGTQAQRRLIEKLQNGDIKLLRGDLLCIPVINPQAYASNQRYIDENLNRVFAHYEQPASYEQKIANEVITLVADRDVLVDFHSITSEGVPFTFRFGDVPAAEEALIQALGLPVIMEGWIEAYAASMPGVDVGQAKHTHAHFRHQGKIAAGVECGQHDDPAAVEVAYITMLRVLKHFGMIKADLPAVGPARAIRLQSVHFCKNDVWNWSRVYKHGDAVKAGEVIVTCDKGEIITAMYDGLILLPRQNCPKGEEAFYLGQYS